MTTWPADPWSALAGIQLENRHPYVQVRGPLSSFDHYLIAQQKEEQVTTTPEIDAGVHAAVERQTAARIEVSDAETVVRAFVAYGLRDSTQTAEIERQAAEIARLRDLLDDPPPPPPAYPLLVGASVYPRTGESKSTSIDRYERTVGPLEVVRLFIDAAPTVANVAAAIAPHAGVRHRIVSAKGEWSPAVLASIPVDGFTTWTLPHHEPDNDVAQGMPTHTPAWFVPIIDRHIVAVRALDRPDVKPALCVTSWLERDNAAGTTSADWFPTVALDGVYLGLDPYDEPAKNSMEFLAGETLRLWRAAGGTHWGIMETGTKRTGAAGSLWMRETVDYLEAQRAAFVCYYDSPRGDRGPWTLIDPDMVATWGALARE